MSNEAMIQMPFKGYMERLEDAARNGLYALRSLVNRHGLLTSPDFPCPYCDKPSYLFKQGGGKSTGSHIKFTHITDGDNCLTQPPAAAKLDAPHAQGGTQPQVQGERQKFASQVDHLTSLGVGAVQAQQETVEVGQAQSPFEQWIVDTQVEPIRAAYQRGVEAERAKLAKLETIWRSEVTGATEGDVVLIRCANQLAAAIRSGASSEGDGK